jgi:hypothetical protein
VAVCTKGDQVVLLIFSGVTPKCLVVYFEVCSGSTELAAPAIAAQDTLTRLLVFCSFESDRHSFLQKFTHSLFPLTL